MNACFNRYFVFPVIEKIRKEPIREYLRELNKNQNFSTDQIKELQWNKLKLLLEHCYLNVPFYKKRFDAIKLKPEDIKNSEDYKKIGILTKNDIRDNYNELISTKNMGKVEHCHSGGTLGKPLEIIRDSKASAYARAAQWRGLNWHGINLGDKQLRLWGVPFDEKKLKNEMLKDYILNRKRISAFDISFETVVKYYKIAEKFKPKYIYGFTSAIYRMCEMMKSVNLDGKDLGIKYVVSTSETLYDFQRDYIEEFLGCKVINEYGCSEVGVIAFECLYGQMHVSMENVLLEAVDTDSDNISKEFLITNLNCYSMPLLRYKIGDTGIIKETKCSCGCSLDIMNFGEGRVFSTLVAADGSFVAGNSFAYIGFDVIEKYGGIKDFRVVQKSKDVIEITLAKDENFSNKILDLFTNKVNKLLGEGMKIKYEFVDEIPLEKSGKRLFVVSEILRD